MGILLVTHYYHPEFGAPQRRWGELVSRFIDAGHSVAVIAPPPHYPQGRVDPRLRAAHRPGRLERGARGETILRTCYLPHRGDILTRSADHGVAAADAVRRALRHFGLRRRAPDVVIATAPAIESLFAGRALARLWGVPIVVEMRDAWPDLVTNIAPELTAGTGLRSRVVARVKSRIHRRVTGWQRSADQVVTTTARFAAILTERGIAGVRVVRNGTDLSRVPLHAPHADAGGRELRCLYLGNLGRSQGLEVVVAAAAALAGMGIPLQVRLIGHGARAGQLRRMAEELGAPVEVRERVDHSQVYEHYAWADTVLVSLRDWLPFEWTVPSKLYEMLATGRHITGIVAGESAGLVTATRAGDVVPPGDVAALTSLWRELAQTPSRTRGGTQGRDWIAGNASDDVLARDYLEILENLVRDHRIGPAAPPAP